MKRLIVNADDLGHSKGINEGIIEAHVKGIVTSTSFMIKGHAAKHGVKLSNKYPKLGIGLHFQITKEEATLLRQVRKVVAVSKIENTKKEFIKQIKLFQKLMGRLPDHIDGHHHVHKLPRIYVFIRKFAQENNIPLRDDVNFIDEFFGISDINKISPKSLIKILNNLPSGTSELMCHPARETANLNSSYSHQREVELKTLTSKEVKDVVNELNIKLITWSDI